MAFDGHRRQTKPLLYSDLFKSAPDMEKHINLTISKMQTSSSSHSLFSSESSSSGFSTPLYSDIGSPESEDMIVAELTRRMAEGMLQEEDEGRATQNCQENDDGSTGMRLIRNEGGISKRRGKTGESAKIRKKIEETGHARSRSSSGMQAVFLGGSGSGSRSLSTGTGVFLPRISSNQTEPKRKSGCPMVLIPTRVLQVLELHFNRVQGSTASPNGLCTTDGDSQLENEMQLPQEWTY